MNIRLRLFGPAADLAGTAETTLNVEPGTTLGGLAGVVSQRWPRLGAALGMRLAVNRAYAALDHKLQDNDEVAVIPPVSGG